MRSGLVSRLLPALLATGCLVNTELYEERSEELADQAQAGGAYGVRFIQDPDCIMIDMTGEDLDGPFSFEAYIWPDSGLGFGLFPLVVWPGAFALYQDESGYTAAGPADGPDISTAAATPQSVMDGQYHHLALNYGQNGTLSLYIDGALSAYAPIEFDDQPAETLYLGCWPEQEATFVGLIAEARLSDSALYAGDFDPSWEPYELSQATIGLWHLDEGQGDDIFDEAGEHDGVLMGGSWEHFYLGREL